MKNKKQIAKECNLHHQIISNLIRSEGIIGTIINRKLHYDKYQEDVIHNRLFLNSKIDFITIESKLNTIKL